MVAAVGMFGQGSGLGTGTASVGLMVAQRAGGAGAVCRVDRADDLNWLYGEFGKCLRSPAGYRWLGDRQAGRDRCSGPKGITPRREPSAGKAHFSPQGCAISKVKVQKSSAMPEPSSLSGV